MLEIATNALGIQNCNLQSYIELAFQGRIDMLNGICKLKSYSLQPEASGWSHLERDETKRQRAIRGLRPHGVKQLLKGSGLQDAAKKDACRVAGRYC